MPPDLRPDLAEGIGTFFLLLAGGAALAAGLAPPSVALAFGGAVLVLVAALGHASGAHLNPAITLAFAATGHFPWRRVPGYVLAQTLGALAACLLLRPLADPALLVAAGPLDGLPAAGVEAAATALLAFVILAVATDRRSALGVAPLAIGAAVALGALAAGPFTGAAMNPARALAPALVAGDLHGLAARMAGPVVGAVAGMLAYEAVRPAARPVPGEALGAVGPVVLEAAP